MIGTIASRTIVIVAWTFAVGTLLCLAFILLPGDPYSERVGRVMSVGTPSGVKSSWGLTYPGVTGHVWAFTQAVLLTVMLVASTARRSLPRRVGLVYLLVWSGLWAANAIWLWSLPPAGSWVSLVFVVFFACTVGRLVVCWGTRV